MLIVREFADEDLIEVAQVYAQGLLMEAPPGSEEPLESLIPAIRGHLKEWLQTEKTRRLWVAIIKNRIRGLLDFYHEPSEIRVRFIATVVPRQGIGTHLMVELAKYAVAHQVEVIHSSVSSIDKRAQQFYFQHLGFTKIGQRPESPGFDLFLVSVKPQELLRRFSA